MAIKLKFGGEPPIYNFLKFLHSTGNQSACKLFRRYGPIVTKKPGCYSIDYILTEIQVEGLHGKI